MHGFTKTLAMEVAKKGIDGKKLASEARALIAKYNR